jgi:hypothetical protein
MIEELTDAQYELADQIETVVTQRPNGWTPSAVARKIGSDANLRPIMQWMVRHHFLVADRDDLNSWTHYYPR